MNNEDQRQIYKIKKALKRHDDELAEIQVRLAKLGFVKSKDGVKK